MHKNRNIEMTLFTKLWHNFQSYSISKITNMDLKFQFTCTKIFTVAKSALFYMGIQYSVLRLKKNKLLSLDCPIVLNDF